MIHGAQLVRGAKPFFTKKKVFREKKFFSKKRTINNFKIYKLYILISAP